MPPIPYAYRPPEWYEGLPWWLKATLPDPTDVNAIAGAPLNIQPKVLKNLSEETIENIPNIVSNSKLVGVLKDFFAKKRGTGFIGGKEGLTTSEKSIPAFVRPDVGGVYVPMFRNIGERKAFADLMKRRSDISSDEASIKAFLERMRWRNPVERTQGLVSQGITGGGLYLNVDKSPQTVLMSAEHEMKHLGQDVSGMLPYVISERGRKPFNYELDPAEVGATLMQMSRGKGKNPLGMRFAEALNARTKLENPNPNIPYHNVNVQRTMDFLNAYLKSRGAKTGIRVDEIPGFGEPRFGTFQMP